MNTEHKYKTVMTVMNKLMNTLQAKNPDCLQELRRSTAVRAPAAKETPTAKNLQQSHAIVASRFGGGVLSITGGEGVNVDTFRQVRVRSFVFHTHVQQIDSTLPESHPACAQFFRCLCLRCQRCKNPSDGDSIEVHGSSSG